MIPFRPSVSLLANVLVMILRSQFDRVMGLQFLSSVRSLPSFGNSLRYESLCDGHISPDFNAKFQESISNGPKNFHVNLMSE